MNGAAGFTTTWAGVAAIFIVSVTTLIKTWMDGRKINDMHGQTVNGHGGKGQPNLRQDLDRIDSKIDGLVKRLDEHIEKCPPLNPSTG